MRPSMRVLLLVCVGLQPSSAFLVTMRPRGVVLRLRDSHAVRMMAEPTKEVTVTTQGESRSEPRATSTLHALHAAPVTHERSIAALYNRPRFGFLRTHALQHTRLDPAALPAKGNEGDGAPKAADRETADEAWAKVCACLLWVGLCAIAIRLACVCIDGVCLQPCAHMLLCRHQRAPSCLQPSGVPSF